MLLTVTDTSSNGTFVNGARLQGSRAVSYGDQIAVAQVATLEVLLGIRRAGADVILTYHARDAADWLG